MPTVQWINDNAPSTPPDQWELRIGGQLVDLDDLRAASAPVEAALDCTGGWWSKQSWDAVALSPTRRRVSDAQHPGHARRPATRGCSRPTMPIHLYLAVGYGGRPLRRGHGAPVRLIAPGAVGRGGSSG